jgi:hypothetical protein
MGSTNKTSLGLNQWLPTDKPVMNDFNQDNIKINDKMSLQSKSQMFASSRDISVAGVQTITGLLGVPKRIEIRATANVARFWSIGSWEITTNNQSYICQYVNNASTMWYASCGSGSAIALPINEGGNYALGTIQNITATQFEILWAKTGAPTGTTQLYIVVEY